MKEIKVKKFLICLEKNYIKESLYIYKNIKKEEKNIYFFFFFFKINLKRYYIKKKFLNFNLIKLEILQKNNKKDLFWNEIFNTICKNFFKK